MGENMWVEFSADITNLDISDMSREDFDELLIEQRRNVVWIHFAVRPSGNRRRCNFKR
jgi:hypothetical protein